MLKNLRDLECVVTNISKIFVLNRITYMTCTNLLFGQWVENCPRSICRNWKLSAKLFEPLLWLSSAKFWPRAIAHSFIHFIVCCFTSLAKGKILIGPNLSHSGIKKSQTKGMLTSPDFSWLHVTKKLKSAICVLDRHSDATALLFNLYEYHGVKIDLLQI